MDSVIFAGPSSKFRSPQCQNYSVLVRRPDAAVTPQETCSGACFAAEADRAVEQTGRKPLEAHRHSGEATPKIFHHAINHAAADERFTDGRLSRPVGTMRKQVVDRHSKEMIWIHQPYRR